MKSAADIWICKSCRSINSLRSGRCYRCNTPIDVGAAKPEDLSIAHTPSPMVPTGTFRSSESRAVAVSLATMVFIATTLVALWVNWTVWAHTEDPSVSRFAELRLPGLLAAVAVGLAAALAYAAWIRRIVENLPALGVGYAKVSPTWAFFEPLIPGFNVYSIAARLSEAITKLGGHRSAMPLLGLALFFAITPAVVLFWLLRGARIALPFRDFIEFQAFGLLVLFCFEAIALVIGLIVVWQVEGLARRKAAEVAAEA